jgi:hypothetical protein
MMGGRRLASVATAVVLALGGTLIAATSAQAAGGCSVGIGVSYQAGSYISGSKYKTCDNGQPDIPLYVTVERYLSPNNFQVVASGYGDATYYCQGWEYFVFRAAGQAPFPILCT